MRVKCTITLLLLSLICICAACKREEEYVCIETRPPEIAPVDSVAEREVHKKFYELPEGIQNVILGDGKFFDVEQDRTFTKDSFQVEVEEVGVCKVRWHAVLRLNDEGMIYRSSGADDFDIYTLEFYGKEYRETVVAGLETKSGSDPEYSLRGRTVSEKEFFDFGLKHAQRQVLWERYENAELE